MPSDANVTWEIEPPNTGVDIQLASDGGFINAEDSLYRGVINLTATLEAPGYEKVSETLRVELPDLSVRPSLSKNAATITATAGQKVNLRVTGLPDGVIPKWRVEGESRILWPHSLPQDVEDVYVTGVVSDYNTKTMTDVLFDPAKYGTDTTGLTFPITQKVYATVDINGITYESSPCSITVNLS